MVDEVDTFSQLFADGTFAPEESWQDSIGHDGYQNFEDYSQSFANNDGVGVESDFNPVADFRPQTLVKDGQVYVALSSLCDSCLVRHLQEPSSAQYWSSSMSLNI